VKYGVHNVFVSLPVVTLTFDFSTPKSNQHICEPKYTSDQNWVKFPSLVFEIWWSQGFRALTHSLTNGQTRLQNTSGPVFNVG